MKLLARLCYLFLLLVIPFFSTAQSNFRSGTVQLIDGTTISGYIRINNWNTTPLKIAFKQNRGNAATSYSPNELLGFEAEGYVYQSALVDVEISPSNSSYLDYSSTLKVASKHIFLQQIQGGDKPLYLNRTQLGKKNFYIKDEGQFILLKHKQYKQENSAGIDKVRTNKSYVTQLVEILSDCPRLNQNISKTAYTKRDLVQLLNSYSHCSGSTIDYVLKKSKTPIKFGLFFGAAYSHLSITEQGVDPLNDFNLAFPTDNSIDPTGGVYIDIILPFDQQKWSIRNEVAIIDLQRRGSYRNIIDESNYRLTTIDLQFTHFKMNHLIRYTYRLPKLELLLNGGVSHAFLINESNRRIVEIKQSNFDISTIRTTAVDSVRPHELGTVIGLGVQYGNWSLETRYESTSQIAKFKEFQSKKTRIYLLLGFRL